MEKLLFSELRDMYWWAECREVDQKDAIMNRKPGYGLEAANVDKTDYGKIKTALESEMDRRIQSLITTQEA